MKYIPIFILLSMSSASGSPALPHMDLEFTSSEYARLLNAAISDDQIQKHVLSPVMDMGKRNLEWLKYINDHREPAQQISFSSPASQPAYPVDRPRVSNPTLILEEFDTIKGQLPVWYSKILFEGAPFTVNPPVSDTEFIQLGMRADFNYQRASRWILQEPNLAQYTANKTNDVRGYYYFNQDSNHKEKLSQWPALTAEEQARYTAWLTGLCLNAKSQTEKTCRDLLAQDLTANKHPVAYFNEHIKSGMNKWNSFFELGVKRPNVEWTTENPDITKVAFLEPPMTLPNSTEIKSFLVQNIEDEWRLGKWRLILDFKTSGDFPLIEFVAGATPHVNKLGGNTITMDANQPLTEYNVRWTIRHEYGHVLGFPDCYVEFYDTAQTAMISYQLDISNLMCSRRGHLNDSHLSELKRVHFPAAIM